MLYLNSEKNTIISLILLYGYYNGTNTLIWDKNYILFNKKWEIQEPKGVSVFWIKSCKMTEYFLYQLKKAIQTQKIT